MNETILSDIKNAKEVYPLVLYEIRKFGIKMAKLIDAFSFNGIRDRNLLEKLHKITGKDISIIDSYIVGWESNPFWYEYDFQNYSINISLPEPKVIKNITQEELYEIWEIVKSENYGYYANDFFERKFYRQFNDYFEKLLEINLQHLMQNID